MKKIKAVLFDVDGTLLNTDKFINGAFRHTVLKHFNRKVTKKEISEIMGRPLAECYQYLCRVEEVAYLAKEHMDFQQRNLHLSLPFKNTEETLQKLQNAGIKIGAVTTRHTDTLHKTLKNARVFDYLQVIIDGDSVKNHKPHPEAVVKAMKLLEVRPSETIMVGDTQSDILAGKNAGTITVGATYGFYGKKIKNFDPDYLIGDISELLEIAFS